MPDPDKSHVFERAGLGKPPYKYLGMEKRSFQAAPDAPIQPGSCCDYCHTGIHFLFHLRSSDGNKFKVGSDCILKSGDAGLKRVITADMKKLNDERRAARVGREEGRIAVAKDALEGEALRGILASAPHPFRSLAEKGGTLLDYVEWSFANAGHTGCLGAAKIVERHLEQVEASQRPATGMQVVLALFDAPSAAMER